MATESKVRRVKPYPFKAQFKDARGLYQGQIVKLTVKGLMIDVPGTAVQPGDKVEVSFVTPVLAGTVVAAGVVVKIYNQTGETLVEIHFRSLPPESLKHIARFLEGTGEVKKS